MAQRFRPRCPGFTPRVDGNILLALEGTLDGWEHRVKDYSGAEPTILRLVQSIVERRRVRLGYQVPGREWPSRFLCDPYRLLWVQRGLHCVGAVPAYDRTW